MAAFGILISCALACVACTRTGDLRAMIQTAQGDDALLYVFKTPDGKFECDVIATDPMEDEDDSNVVVDWHVAASVTYTLGFDRHATHHAFLAASTGVISLTRAMTMLEVAHTVPHTRKSPSEAFEHLVGSPIVPVLTTAGQDELYPYLQLAQSLGAAQPGPFDADRRIALGNLSLQAIVDSIADDQQVNVQKWRLAVLCWAFQEGPFRPMALHETATNRAVVERLRAYFS